MPQKKNIQAIVNIVGDNVNRTINAHFSIINRQPVQKIWENGIVSKGLSGSLTKSLNGKILKVSSASIKAYKDGILKDYTNVDENGNYILYLEQGVYDIEIKSVSLNRTIKNFVVDRDNSITEYFKSAYGQIINKNKNDVTTIVWFFDNGVQRNLYHVEGKLVNYHGEPFRNAEIIVADSKTGQVSAFIKTNKNGKYEFLLDEGVYDVIVRSEDRPAVRVKEFNFVPENGFMSEIISNYLKLNKGGDWIWILE